MFIWNSLKRLWTHRYGHIHFRLMDINCVCYVGLIGFLLIFFHRGVEHWFLIILLHGALAIAILEIVRLGEAKSHTRPCGYSGYSILSLSFFMLGESLTL